MVAAPIVFGRLHVVPVVTEFLAAYPKVDVKLLQNDRLAHLVEDQIDCAVRIGELPDSSVIATRLGTVRRVVCASPAYLEKHRPLKKPGDIAVHDCITAEVLGVAERWSFGAGRTQAEVSVRSRLIVNTLEAAIDAAVAGTSQARA